MKVSLVLLFLTFSVGLCAENGSLEQVDEDELLALFRNEKYVIVLFTKDNCPECDQMEQLLINLREDLVETIGAWVVKAVGSTLVRLYDPSKEPSLVFFRHGVPLLYHGPLSEDEILHMFTDNKEPVVKELSDDTFEGLTQAATGATTGDWFIMFYSNECVDCQRLQARWETVGAKLKTRLNVARINRKTNGRVTSRRFHIIEEPTFILFRLGKMYYYNIPKYDIQSFTSFATDWYKNAKSEKVPLPKSPFDDFTQAIADYLRENTWLLKLGSIIVCIFVTLSTVKRLKSAKKPIKKARTTEEKPLVEKVKKSK